MQKTYNHKDIPELQYVQKERIGVNSLTGSSEELSKSIEELPCNPEKRDTMGRKGRKYASNFL